MTAAIALPVLAFIVQYADRSIFIGLTVLVSTLGLYEFYEMTLTGKRRIESYLALSFGALFCGYVCSNEPATALFVLTVIFLLLAVVYLFRFGELSLVIQHLAITFLGLLYIPFLLGHLALLRGLPYGSSWVFLVLVVAMVGDSAALFVGSAVGRRKLYPSISPNKSIEGALGGLAGSVLGAVVFKLLFFPQADLVMVVGLAIVLSVAAQLGDLFESMLKRSCQVKDSGKIIPGHGGILDRLDSLLFVFPAAYYLIGFFG